MDGFIGALLAAIIGGLVAFGVAKWLVSKENARRTADQKRADAQYEEQRQRIALQDAEQRAQNAEDRRLNQAFQTLDDLQDVAEVIAVGSREDLGRAVTKLLGRGARLQGLYGHMDDHRDFAEWFHGQVRAFSEKTRTLNNSQYPQGKRSLFIAEVVAELEAIEKSTLRWISAPQEWAPDLDSQD